MSGLCFFDCLPRAAVALSWSLGAFSNEKARAFATSTKQAIARWANSAGYAASVAVSNTHPVEVHLIPQGSCGWSFLQTAASA